MSKQNKQRNKRAQQKLAKASKSNRQHLGDGQSASHDPHHQPAPHWLKPSGKRGWWNGLKTKAAEAK